MKRQVELNENEIVDALFDFVISQGYDCGDVVKLLYDNGLGTFTAIFTLKEDGNESTD